MLSLGRTANGGQLRGAAGLLCILLGVLACGGPPDVYDRVVLVTINSLRWDHLGSAGYPRATTPFLDELSAEGAVFERAYAGSSTAPLSLATLLTGLELHEHGLRDAKGSLAEGAPTLAERFGERGWSTAAFVSEWSSFEPRGLDRGFAHFDGPPELAQDPYRPADRTVDVALGWLGQLEEGTPAFLLVQLQDPKRPYRAPGVYLPMVMEGETIEDYYAFLEREHGIPMGWYAWQHTKLNAVFNNYDAELRFVDTELRRLRDGLAALGLLDRTLLVVTSEHGAGLGSHFWDAAGRFLYEEQVRVPLIVATGDGSVAPRRIPDVVSHTDVMPTILALVSGEEAVAGAEASGSGRSLVPLLAGRPLEARSVFFDRGEQPTLDADQLRRLARSPNLPSDGPLVGGVDGRWKVIDAFGPRDGVYDLEADPLEQQNLQGRGAELPPEVAALRASVAERSPFAPKTSAPAVDR